MKSCPACNRTFEDTFTFCLVDGSILSAPFDPQATRAYPSPRNTDPTPPEAVPSLTMPAEDSLPPTIAAPPPIFVSPSSMDKAVHSLHPSEVKRPNRSRNISRQKGPNFRVVSAVFFILWVIGVYYHVGGLLFHVPMLGAALIAAVISGFTTRR